jgi:hypothetical protein
MQRLVGLHLKGSLDLAFWLPGMIMTGQRYDIHSNHKP